MRVVVLRGGQVAFQGTAAQLRDLGEQVPNAVNPLDAALVRLERGQ
ncbi:MAG: hypothetical protein ACOYEV_15900 [Candidatus Nanopelagicales bacterium]